MAVCDRSGAFRRSAGIRLTAKGHVLAYTGDTGPSPEITTMAGEADILLAEATFAEHVMSKKDPCTCRQRARPASTPLNPAPEDSFSPISGPVRTR
jgi:ribonuclease BN (tRNA processing enzyme)